MCLAARVYDSLGALSITNFYLFSAGRVPGTVEYVTPNAAPFDELGEIGGEVVHLGASGLRRIVLKLRGLKNRGSIDSDNQQSPTLMPTYERSELPTGHPVLAGRQHRWAGTHHRATFDDAVWNGIPDQHRRTLSFDASCDAMVMLPLQTGWGGSGQDTYRWAAGHPELSKGGTYYDGLDPVGTHALLKKVPLILSGQLGDL